MSDDTKTPRKAKEVYNRVIVQLAEDGKTCTIVEDLGPTTTVKAQAQKRRLEKTLKLSNLAVVYWVG